MTARSFRLVFGLVLKLFALETDYSRVVSLLREPKTLSCARVWLKKKTECYALCFSQWLRSSCAWPTKNSLVQPPQACLVKGGVVGDQALPWCPSEEKRLSCITASSADPISLPCFGGLGCLGLLAKAESGNTVFPPAGGFERLGSRVPSAGTGTWSLLVRARKQAPDFLLALGQSSGQLKLLVG